MNNRGIKFIHDKTRPMAVNTMDEAAKIIHRRIVERDNRIKEGKPLSTDTTEAFARGIAWVVGFDHLIDDRKAIHDVVDKVVQP